MTLVAPMLQVVHVVQNRGFPLGVGISGIGYLYAVWASIPNATSASDHVDILLVWAVVYAICWAVGLLLPAWVTSRVSFLEGEIERQRFQIAAELHDTVAHDLSLIVMTAERARVDPQLGGPEALGQVAERARRASMQLRALMTLLEVEAAPPLLAFHNVLAHSKDALARAGFESSVMVQGDLGRITSSTGDLLSRLLREAVNNVVRHGSPSGGCVVLINVEETVVELGVTNVCHRPTGEVRPGVGLTGMRDRVEAAGGTMTVSSQSPDWRLALSVPMLG